MKKILSILICIMILVCGVGCSNNTKEKATRTVNEYFSYIKKGKYFEALNICNDQVNDKFGLRNIGEGKSSLLNNPSKELTTVFDNWLIYTVSKTVKEYEIIDTTIVEDSYEVYVTGTMLDFNDLEIKLEYDLPKAMDQYITENLEELNHILSNTTNYEEAMKTVNDKLYNFTFNEMKTIVDNTKYIDFAMKFSLKQEDDQLKIIEIEDAIIAN